MAPLSRIKTITKLSKGSAYSQPTVITISEAAMAAHAAFKRLRPDDVLRFEYSTTKGVPGG